MSSLYLVAERLHRLSGRFFRAHCISSPPRLSSVRRPAARLIQAQAERGAVHPVVLFRAGNSARPVSQSRPAKSLYFLCFCALSQRKGPCLCGRGLVGSRFILRCGSRRGYSSASSSCRRTYPRCRTQPPSPAPAWPWRGLHSTPRCRRGGAGR